MKSMIDYLGKLERQITRFSLQVILTVLGPEAAGRYLSYSPIVRRTQARILWLHEQIRSRYGQKAANRFATDYLSARPRLQDYGIVLVGTGRCRPSEDALAAAMPAILRTAERNSGASIALVSNLLQRGDIDLALKLADDLGGDTRTGEKVDWPALLHALLPHHLYETKLDRLALANSARSEVCKNRLLIMDEKLAPAAIRSLASGAEKVTLLQYKDLYGRIDLAEIQAEIPECEITIEHGRSRVDRFHQRYYDIHMKTLEAAEAFSKSFIMKVPWVAQNVPDLEAFGRDLTLELSDKLFFKTLRLEGIYQAAIDPSFDSVVVSFGNSFELFRFFYSTPALWTDSRIKGCCRSQKIQTVTKYPNRIADMQRRAAVGSRDPILAVLVELEERRDSVEASAPPTKVGEYLLLADGTDTGTTKKRSSERNSIAFVANDSRPYLQTSLQLAMHLHSRFNVDILLTQGNPAKVQQSLDKLPQVADLTAEGGVQKPRVHKVAAPPPDKTTTSLFSDVFLLAIAESAANFFTVHAEDLTVRVALDAMLSDGLPLATLQTMGNTRRVAAHLKEQSYSAIAISPIRTANNAMFATIARSLGVPSIAVEPHFLNAAYCRYGTVSSDYAAIYSDYFAQEYDRFFGIPKDRCYAIGSPRVLQPEGYDPIASRKAARSRIGLHEGDPPVVAFPTQPMPREYILAVWRMIIRATKTLDRPVRVILKTHPEEGPGHVARYRQVILEEDASTFCFVADVDIKDLLIASEFVLNCYSTTAIEAAVLERNVAIVGLDSVDYPMPWHEILGVPRCNNAKCIAEAISDALQPGSEASLWTKRFKEKNPTFFDNSTFGRLADAIEDIIAKGPRNIRRNDELPSSLFVTAPFREYLV